MVAKNIPGEHCTHTISKLTSGLHTNYIASMCMLVSWEVLALKVKGHNTNAVFELVTPSVAKRADPCWLLKVQSMTGYSLHNHQPWCQPNSSHKTHKCSYRSQVHNLNFIRLLMNFICLLEAQEKPYSTHTQSPW